MQIVARLRVLINFLMLSDFRAPGNVTRQIFVSAKMSDDTLKLLT